MSSGAWLAQPRIPYLNGGQLLTADGQIRNCLFATTETDLPTLLRAGATDDQLATAWHGAVATKLPGHGINDPGFLQPARPMSAIGADRPRSRRAPAAPTGHPGHGEPTAPARLPPAPGPPG